MAAAGKSVPALENRPTLLPGLDFYLNAYRELRYDRQIGMGIGPIPWSSIDRWAERHGLDNDELEILEHHIRVIEAELGKFSAEKENKANNRRKRKDTKG